MWWDREKFGWLVPRNPNWTPDNPSLRIRISRDFLGTPATAGRERIADPSKNLAACTSRTTTSIDSVPFAMSLTNANPLEAARAARLSSRKLAVLPTQGRNDALTAIHAALTAAQADILAANSRDLEAATQAAQSGELKESLIKRLDLGRKGKYEDMLQGILDVRDLEDPRM